MSDENQNDDKAEGVIHEEDTLQASVSVTIHDGDLMDYDMVLLLHRRHGNDPCEGVEVMALSCDPQTANNVVVLSAIQIASDQQNEHQQKH